MAFANVKTLDSKAKSPRKGIDKETVEIPGLDTYAPLDMLIKNLTTVAKTVKEELYATALDVFVQNAKGHRPPNFRGFEGKSEASVELRKRSSLSPLTDEEVELLSDNDVPFGTIDDVAGTFVINPEYAQDDKLLAKVEKALASVKDLPQDFILKQEPKTRRVVTDESIDAVFAKDLHDLVTTVSTLAVKAQTKQSLAEALETARKLLAPASTLKADLKESIKKIAS